MINHVISFNDYFTEVSTTTKGIIIDMICSFGYFHIFKIWEIFAGISIYSGYLVSKFYSLRVSYVIDTRITLEHP